MAKKKAKIVPMYPELGNMSEQDLIQAFIDLMAGGGITAMKRKSKPVPRVGKFAGKVTYQFKIKLRGITKPPVWRRVQVPSQFTFRAFHNVIQEAFGWWDEHLWQFNDTPYNNEFCIAVPHPDDWDKPTHNARKLTLGEFFQDGKVNTKLTYTYDFGDDWIHEIVLEEVMPEERAKAVCVAGKGACPEEDCGGPYGYTALKEEGEVSNPGYFSPEDVNDAVMSVKAK